jgi:hypothetical protein
MNHYLEKFGFQPPQIDLKPNSNLGLIVVIPCFAEPNIIDAINSLATATPPNCQTEVIVVINHGVHQSVKIKNHNQKSARAIAEWQKLNKPFFHLHIIRAFDLPKKHAGVGLARKIGMDEAVARFHKVNRDGVIVCFDADAMCDQNYLMAIENHFNDHLKTPGAAIKFEHPIAGLDFDDDIYEGIINYELFLRYYNQGLKYANLPYAFHTVGSSMAVRSSAYQKQGGMNKRKAGEDFYFLHKIIALGHFTEINTTTVRPSPRTSDRVPFGTGKAITDWIQNSTEEYLTYDFRIWEIIKDFCAIIPQLQQSDLKGTTFYKTATHKCLIDFLEQNNFHLSLEEIRTNSTSEPAFLKRFFVWFNAFRILKLVHFLRDEQFPNQSLVEQAKLMAIKRGFYRAEINNKDLLIAYRTFEAEKN